MTFFTFWNVECEMAGVHMCYFATTIANVEWSVTLQA